jgi:hypothetical protein
MVVRSQRHSGIEFLRIVAMLLIILNHYPWVVQREFMPSVFNSLLSNWGGVGDCLFFMISAWFLCMEQPDVKRSFRRVWLLERELLVYSLPLLVFMALCGSRGLVVFSRSEEIKLAMKSFFPALTGLWWYPTSYMAFLLLSPWLLIGLRAVGESLHRNLVILALVSSSIVPIVSHMLRERYSFVLFIYLFILVSYVRWYMPEKVRSRKRAVSLICIGLSVGIAIPALFAIVFASHVQRFYYLFLNNPWLFPSLMISMGLLMIASQAEDFHSRAVNTLAQATLAPYLLLTFPGVTMVFSAAIFGAGTKLVTGLFSLSENPSIQLGRQTFAAVVFFLCAECLDLVRIRLFSVTLNRHGNQGKWFELLWCRLTSSKVGVWLES